MPKRDEAPLGAPCWVDLFSADPTRAKQFYGQLFGWTAEDTPEEYGGYVNFSKDGVLVAGCMRNDGTAGTPDRWSIYLATDSAEGTVNTALASGGHAVVPAMEVMHLGSMAMVADVGGAAIGIWQPGAHKGFGVLAEPGTPAWFELHTPAYDASVRFYQDVFKWDTSVDGDAPDFRYTTLGEGADALAGIMDNSAWVPEGTPGEWSVYFAVDNADATLAQATELGGAVLEPAVDTPYGRLARAADPTGATFKLMSPVS